MNPKHKKEYAPLGGISELLPQEEKSATRVENWSVDPSTGGWDNRIGYEKFFPAAPAWEPFHRMGRIESLYIWNTHNGARTYHLFEVENATTGIAQLKYTVGNVAGAGGLTNIDLSRSIPTPNEPMTQYEPFGRYLIIVNGHDFPMKFDGENTTPLGWIRAPHPPTPWSPAVVLDAEPNTQLFMLFNDYYNLIPDVNVIGLGIKTASTENAYSWKVSFVSETGSESPLSAASEQAQWETGAVLASQAVYLEDVPIGPDGTVARRIYRTKNIAPEASSGEYYYVGQINNNTDSTYTDSTPDRFLADLAPTSDESVTLPAPACRFAATFKNTLFLDGGQLEPTRIYYSNGLHPDSFSALNYFDVGTREGGDITGFAPYYNQLLVFRERAIEIIRGDASGGFSVAPFIQGVGTKSISTVTMVPSVGLVFLSEDGVYRLNGGLDGGAELVFEKISKTLVKTMGRLNRNLLARATAAYSPKWREWHCYVPADGNDRPNLGLVFHIDKNSWSTREGFPVGALSVDQDGNLIFGHSIGDLSVGPHRDTGLFVISRQRTDGYTYNPLTDPVSATPNAPPVSVYQSPWLDYGAPQKKKHVKYVYLYVMTAGDNAIPITYYTDFDYTGKTSAAVKIQRADHVDQNVYGKATWDASVWENPMFTCLRYPIAQGACSHFSFKIETSQDLVLLGYSVELAATNTSTVKGKR
jgi:hypothetical protein